MNINGVTGRSANLNHIPLPDCYRVADYILDVQARKFREDDNIVDLFIVLLRFASLIGDVVPLHGDYPAFCSEEKIIYEKKLLNVIDEIESLRLEFFCRLIEMDTAGVPRIFSSGDHARMSQVMVPYLEDPRSSMKRPHVNGNYSLVLDQKQHSNLQPQSSRSCNEEQGQDSQSSSLRSENKLSNLKNKAVDLGPTELFEATRHKKGKGLVDLKVNNAHLKILELQDASTTKESQPHSQEEIDIEFVLGHRSDQIEGMDFRPMSKRCKCSSSSSTNQVSQHEHELKNKVAQLEDENAKVRDELDWVTKKLKEEYARRDKERAEDRSEVARLRVMITQFMSMQGGSSK